MLGDTVTEMTTCKYCHGTGLAPMGDDGEKAGFKPTKCGFCDSGQEPVWKSIAPFLND